MNKLVLNFKIVIVSEIHFKYKNVDFLFMCCIYAVYCICIANKYMYLCVCALIEQVQVTMLNMQDL